MFLYRGLTGPQGDGPDDGERFVYLTKRGGRSPIAGDCFVLLQTIQDRIKSDGRKLQADIKHWKKKKQLRFSVWNALGQIDAGLALELGVVLNPSGDISVDTHFLAWTSKSALISLYSRY